MNWQNRARCAHRASRSPRRSWVPGIFALEPRTLLSAVNVPGYRDPGVSGYSETNAGLNSMETTLTPANVKSSTFGKLATTPVDGQVYAQVLIYTPVNVTVGPERGFHTVAYVATENDSLYAIDATNGVVLWHDRFNNPSAGITAVPSVDTGADNITPQIGITSTPVIDPVTGLIYVMAETKQVRFDGPHYVWTLEAVNIGSGAGLPGSSVVVADTLYVGGNYTYETGPSVAGQGDGSVAGVVHFNALRAEQRSELTLSHGDIFTAFASNGDIAPYHGWILGFSASTLKLTAAFNDTPNGSDGGIWDSGAGLVFDPQGYLYVATGNGTFDESLNAAGYPSRGDYGDSVLKLAIDPTSSPTNPNPNGWGLKVVDYFTPKNEAYLNAQDLDLDSGGVTILPDSVGSALHRHLLVAAGKQGEIYLIDRDNMGKFHPNADYVVQEINNSAYAIFTSPAEFGSTLYYAGVGQSVTVYTISAATIKQVPRSSTSTKFIYPGATPMVSSNGGSNGIVWVLERAPSTLQAYNARNLHQMLYSSGQAARNRDLLGQVVKFSVPTIANGRVYVATFNSLDIYGLLPRRTPRRRRHR